MAIADTSPPDKKSGEGTDPDVEQQLTDLVALVERISKLALFASVVVLNPVVKWGVYAASFSLGSVLLGPVPGATPAEISLSAGPGILARLLVGNLILAVVLTAVGYVVVLRLVTSFRARNVSVSELLPDVGSK